MARYVINALGVITIPVNTATIIKSCIPLMISIVSPHFTVLGAMLRIRSGATLIRTGIPLSDFSQHPGIGVSNRTAFQNAQKNYQEICGQINRFNRSVNLQNIRVSCDHVKFLIPTIYSTLIHQYRNRGLDRFLDQTRPLGRKTGPANRRQ
jgi:hypothetical protein